MFKLKELSFNWSTVLIVFLVFISLSLFLLNSILNEEITAMKSYDVYISYDEKPTVYILTFATYTVFWLASLLYLALAALKFKYKESDTSVIKKTRKRKKNKK